MPPDPFDARPQPYGEVPAPPPSQPAPGYQPYNQPGYGPYGQPPTGYYGQPPPGYGPYNQPGYGPYGSSSQSEATTLAVLVHLSLFAFGLVGPLVLYLVKKDSSPFLRHHAAQALNFHITVAIAVFASFALVFVLIGFVLLPAVAIASSILAIVAAVRASRGEPYRYPLTIPFVN